MRNVTLLLENIVKKAYLYPLIEAFPRMRKCRLSAVKYHLKRHGMEIIRATKTAQQAGAYYVRIQAMARKHQIPLDEEFDEHDTPATKYIVAVDDFLPVATCRLYAIDSERVMLGRIVVLPEYRHAGLGTRVVQEAERWARELGYEVAVVESRDNKIHFYETMGYAVDYSQKIIGNTFTCFRMEKKLI